MKILKKKKVTSYLSRSASLISFAQTIYPPVWEYLYQGRWLQTPGMPPQGRLTRRSWTLRACLNCRVGCVQMNSPNTFIRNWDASINASRGSKWMWCSVGGVESWGSKGRRVGEGKTGRGRGADIRRADSSQISLHLCDKGSNGFRWGKLQRDMYHLPLRARGGSQDSQSKGNERQGCEETSWNVLRITSFRSEFV